jgi:riboflavin synthase
MNQVFTGIIEVVGVVVDVGREAISIDAPLENVDIGESVAVNGCCLTVVDKDPLRFDVSPETQRRTSLGDLRPGDPVNIERAMAAGGRFGGHIVQGHVDATGVIRALEQSGEFAVLRVEGLSEYGRYLIDKGSIAVDGISLTVVNPVGGAFEVHLIPHTLIHTNLHAKRPSDRVNLEYDLIAKYVEKLAASAAKG